MNKKDIKYGHIDSFFGEGIYLEGSLKFKGLLRFDGELNGDISSGGTFIVGKSGVMKGKIDAAELYNFGKIEGDVSVSKKISLHAFSSLKGDIETPYLATDAEALFIGRCSMKSRDGININGHARSKIKLPAPSEVMEAYLSRTLSSPSSSAVSPLKLVSYQPKRLGFAIDTEDNKNEETEPLNDQFFFRLLLAILLVAIFVLGGIFYNRYNLESSDDFKTGIAVENKIESEPGIALDKIKADAIKSPKDQAIQMKYIEGLLALEKYKEAALYLEGYLKDYPDNAKLNKTTGELFTRLGKENLGLKFLKLYVDKASEDTRELALVNKGYDALSINAGKEAKKIFETVLETAPLNTRARTGLANALFMLGESKLAKNELESILSGDAQYIPAMNILAKILAQDSQSLKKAKQLSEDSMKFFDDIPDYIATLAEINYKLGNKDEAIRLIKKASLLSPENPYFKRELFKYQSS